jgi:hypothetical protein
MNDWKKISEKPKEAGDYEIKGISMCGNIKYGISTWNKHWWDIPRLCTGPDEGLVSIEEWRELTNYRW